MIHTLRFTLFIIFLFLPLIVSANSPVYRFYSSAFHSHFYTISSSERNAIISGDSHWRYEGIFAQSPSASDANASPLYRFWSEAYQSHFFTPDEREKDALIANDPYWTYEGIAYWVFKTNVSRSTPVYRFWSPVYRSHFYTASNAEKDHLTATDDAWIYEGVAYYLPLSSTSSNPSPSYALLRQGFDDENIGAYRNSDFDSDDDWTSVRWNEVDDRAQIVDVSGNKKLRMTYPAGAYGSGNSGGQALVDLGNDHKELYFRQTVRFEDGFDWQRGGKLPGLSSGGSTWSGGNKPSQGEGFSARYMWRDNGRAILYLYHRDQASNYGDEIDLGFYFTKNSDYTITQRIRRNTDTGADGVVEVWVSVGGGAHQKVLSRSNFRLGAGNTYGHIDSLYFSTYFGGGDPSWAPDTTSYITFDDFVVSQSRFSDLQ